MAQHQSDFLNILDSRGFINQATDVEAIDTLAANKKPVAAYIGYDLTGDSLHIGNLVGIMMLRHWQQCGHKPLIVLGGATSQIGDPSGKDESRQLLDKKQIDQHIKGIRKSLEKYLAFGTGPTDAEILDNQDWFKDIGYIDFLREVGIHFTINRMLTFESVKQRLEREQPLTFLEFNYMILQAYDYYRLSDSHSCRLQMGGSDQWGNIVCGVELTRRLGGKDVYGLTSPLLTTATGAKMGKTAQGAIWLNDEKCSAYNFWQYWRNVDDKDVIRFLKLFTELPLEKIEEISGYKGQEINDAKKILANEATRLCHGAEKALEAQKTAEQTFEAGQIAGGLPQITFDKKELEAGISLVDALCRADLAQSKGDARRLIRGGGARVNDEAVGDENMLITTQNADNEGIIKLSAGKKRHALLRIE